LFVPARLFPSGADNGPLVTPMGHRTRPSFRALTALLVTALFLLPSATLALDVGAPASSRALTVWFESPTVKVKKNDAALTDTAIWSSATGKVHLSAARAESEAFQAVVTVGATVSGSVSMSALTGAGGTIQTTNIDTFEVRYPTDVDPDWPDPLVPLTSAPTFAAGRNNPYLIDIHVPNDTVPGLYFGNITITGGADTSTVPVELTVWDITYPKTPTLFTWFDDAGGGWSSYYGLNAYSSQDIKLMENVWRQYAKYKIQPGNCNLGQVGRNNMTVNTGTVSVDFAGTDPYLKFCLDDMGFNSFRFPLSGYGPRRVDMPMGSGHPDQIYYWGAPPYDMNPTYKDHIGQYIKLVSDHYKTKGWFNKTFVYVTDEPIAFNDDMASYFYWGHPDFHVVQQYYNLSHEKAPGIKFINTVQMVPDLWNYTEVWAVPGGTYHELDADGRRADNQTVWWYNTDAGIATPGYEGRALYWDTYARGVDGALYWGTNYWDYASPGGDPWRGSTSNGDGYLFYPANSLGIMDNVVPSQRLILARDGIEDYELLYQYGQIYGVDAARAVAESVAKGSFFAGDRAQVIDDDMIYAVRDWLASEILRARDFKTWSDTFHNGTDLATVQALKPVAVWEGNYGLSYANAPVMVDSLDAIGGWHPNDQPTMNSSVAIDTTQKSQGTGSLKIEWWRNNDPAILGGYSYMRNGRVVTSTIAPKDWSQYQILEMDVRSEEHVPGSLTMLVGDAGGTVAVGGMHEFIRYEAGPAPGWRHAVIDISGATRSNIQYIEPIQYNYAMAVPFHHYAYWLDNITVRKTALSASGTLGSKTIDLGETVSQFAGLEYISQWALPTGTSLSFETRTSDDGTTWSPWLAATPSGQFTADIKSPAGRYIQYRATLTSSGIATPVLSEVRINYKGVTNVNVGLDGLVTDPVVPNDNGTFNLTATVVNRLPSAVSKVKVEFYLNDPAKGGTPLGNVTVDLAASASANASISLNESAGNYRFFARLALVAGLTDLTPADNVNNASVFVNAYPVAIINAPSWAFINESVHFNASGSTDDQGIVEYKWDFGDYNASRRVVTYAYNSSGTKTFKLTVKDQHGAEANVTGNIRIVVRNPTPDFEITPAKGTVLTAFKFNSLTEDLDKLVTNCTWDFGDGTTAHGPKVSHRFDDDKTYVLTMKVVFNNGTLNEASVSKNLTIDNLPPVAVINATVLVADKNVLVGFDGGDSYDPDDPKSELDFSWTFGDGSYGVGETAGHAYIKSGLFNVTLTVKDKKGAQSQATVQVKISNKAPIADFTMPANATVGQNVTFNASKSKDLDGIIVNYSWDFGDGSKAYGHDAVHVFAAPGNYSVLLVVTDDSGASVGNKRTIWIKPKAEPPKPKPKPKPKDLDMMVVGFTIAAVVAAGAMIGAFLLLRKRKGGDKGPVQAPQTATEPTQDPGPAPPEGAEGPPVPPPTEDAGKP